MLVITSIKCGNDIELNGEIFDSQSRLKFNLIFDINGEFIKCGRFYGVFKTEKSYSSQYNSEIDDEDMEIIFNKYKKEFNFVKNSLKESISPFFKWFDKNNKFIEIGS
jgi:uncharacterized C2H2 Zn-finger protein